MACGKDEAMKSCLSVLPVFRGSMFSVRTVLRLTNLRAGRGCQVRRLAVNRGGLLLLVALVISASGRCLLRGLFRGVRISRIGYTARLLVRVSACVSVVLVDPSACKCRVYSGAVC